MWTSLSYILLGLRPDLFDPGTKFASPWAKACSHVPGDENLGKEISIPKNLNPGPRSRTSGRLGGEMTVLHPHPGIQKP